jgi:hypothetical protein
MSCASVHVYPNLITVTQVTFHEIQCDHHATGDCHIMSSLGRLAARSVFSLSEVKMAHNKMLNFNCH